VLQVAGGYASGGDRRRRFIEHDPGYHMADRPLGLSKRELPLGIVLLHVPKVARLSHELLYAHRNGAILAGPPKDAEAGDPTYGSLTVGRKPKLSDYQRQEALKRRAAGETLAEIAKSYAVDVSMISRLQG
jgi:hypothetical protein